MTTPEQRLLERLQSALASFEAEDAVASDRHPDDCVCAGCEFVGEMRALVALGRAHVERAEEDES